jgi:succinate dehydrogenase hydrophobic anchor subunit
MGISDIIFDVVKPSNVDGMHRRLASPSWLDIMVVMALSGILFYLLYVLLKKSLLWRA